MKNNKIVTYLHYAIGEIALVVIGILIAVQIDNWNTARKIKQAEIEKYQDILEDLKEDKELIIGKIQLGKFHQEVHYALNTAIDYPDSFDIEGSYDWLALSYTYYSVTKDNHLGSIDQLKNKEVRIAMNEYFRNQFSAELALERINEVIIKDVRTYFYKNEVLDRASVFHSDIYKFLNPERRSMFNNRLLSNQLKNPEFRNLLPGLRIGTAYMIQQFEFLQIENEKMIELFTEEIAKANS